MESKLQASSVQTIDFPKISSGELHIWSVSLINPPDKLDHFQSVLSDKELARMPFFKFEDARNSFAISQGTLRILLGAYLGLKANLLRIGKKEKGKPYSIDDPGLYFNISNSAGLAVFAFSRNGEVGIDIEQVRSLPDLDEMIDSNFTSNEIRFINSKSEERTNRFFRFWTIKESYLKALGEGMRLPPHHLEFSIEKSQIRHLSTIGVFEQEDWNFKEFSLAGKYVGTLTYVGENVKIIQREYQ